MSSDSSTTAVPEGVNENPKSKTRDVSQKGKGVQKTRGIIHELPVSNEDSQVSKDTLEGGLKDYPLLESAVGLFKKGVEHELAGNKKTDVALNLRIGKILFKSMPKEFWDATLQEAYAAIEASHASPSQHSKKEKDGPYTCERTDNVGDVKEMVGGVKEMVGGVEETVAKLMKVVFERMHSLEEREVASLVAAQPGGFEAVLKNNALLGDVLAAHKSKGGKGAGAMRWHAAGPEEDKTKMVSELRKEMDKPVEQVLEDNKSFDKRLEVVRMQVDEVKVSIWRETDWVIDVPVNGPTSERIIDPDIYQVWKEQGWGDSVEAKLLVSALYDHFTGKPEGSPEDRWALKDIPVLVPVLAVQPLFEELDVDVSSLVTISKVNAFTAARPHTWSLPKWISYWTHGFEMTVQWYLHRIYKVIEDIRGSTNAALSSNLKQRAEDVLPGLSDIKKWDNFNWEDDYVFYKFKDYVVENEGRMERALRGVGYHLDAASTLTIVAGEGRLEKYVLPLLLLLMRKALWVVKQPGQDILHELEAISSSLSTLADAVYDRVLMLQDMYKLQNQDQLSKFFFGLYQIHATTSKDTTPEDPVPLSSGAQKPMDASVPVCGEAAEDLKSRIEESPLDNVEKPEKLHTDSKSRLETSELEEASAVAEGSAMIQENGIGSEP